MYSSTLVVKSHLSAQRLRRAPRLRAQLPPAAVRCELRRLVCSRGAPWRHRDTRGGTRFCAHALRRAVVRIVPLAPAVILGQLSALYPHRTRAPHTQTCFLQNALHVTTYLPALRGDVVAIVVARMLQIDALLTRRDVDEMRARSVAMTTPDDDDDQIFEMEELHVADTKLQTSDKGQLFACLDDLMYVMFAYIHATCWQHNGDEETLNWKAASSLYRELAAAFRRVVLPTHESSHVQYLAFYICSFRPTLADAFLDLLWKGFLDVNASAVARQNCAAYAASLLVRARYVAAATVRTVLTAMAAWIHRYIDGGVDALARPDRAAHLAFYAACQALFYVVAFRHEELARSPGGHAWLRSLNLQRVVTCQLNPLAVCPAAVVLQFASVTRALQIAYCYTVVEHNARNTIPVARDSRASLADALASFFPFEPYVLPKSRRFVATPTLYREFKLSKPDAEKGRKKMEEEDGEEGEEEDDFLHYGSSPGFKRAHLALSPPLLCDMAMSL
ncbi:PREDICTED: RNA polymerase I-specific transcription initiation factor RRN3-like [Priapulus caudatus]|uniref:RNA polymerase I-specific transcription initiation factor RRN3-like n=1 Tax=Priapulus caudatus TaxID=37621 RepID=A0ABM1EW22_PRICU|nr:PREDICTED: RNA polymerase I-specific transcription initiation factor RRN3-like [Priapulus caudatus]